MLIINTNVTAFQMMYVFNKSVKRLLQQAYWYVNLEMNLFGCLQVYRLTVNFLFFHIKLIKWIHVFIPTSVSKAVAYYLQNRVHNIIYKNIVDNIQQRQVLS